MDSNFEQPLKAEEAISVALFGMETETSDVIPMERIRVVPSA